MNEVITNTLGDRITYCRSSLFLTRKELSDLWQGASIPTISRWELDSIRIPLKKLNSLVDFFNAKGLIVSHEWLLEGTGVPPFLLRDDKFDEPDFDSLAQEKLLDLNRQIKNFVFGQVKNNFLSPFIKYGDYIGGINNISNFDTISNFLMGELIFFKKMANITVGILQEIDNQIIINGFNKESEAINIENIDAIGKVQWIIRRP
jgi:hypothetical protein